MAQAIGVFDPVADAATNTLSGALVSAGTASATTGGASTTVAVGDMVEAMRRFAAATPASAAVDNAASKNPAMPAMLASPMGQSDANDAAEQARRLAQLSAPISVLPK